MTTHDMSPRTLEVAALAARGATDDQIAYRLGITRPTVQLHMHNALTATGTTSRVHLAVTLIHDGTLQLHPLEPQWYLTPEHLHLIHDLGAGVPTRVTATNLGVTRAVVAHRWAGLRDAFHVGSNLLVVVRAIRAGYITTDQILNARSAAA